MQDKSNLKHTYCPMIFIFLFFLLKLSYDKIFSYVNNIDLQSTK